MRTVRCSLCDEKPSRKMAAFYWAWTWPTGDRRAYKQLMDAQCSVHHLERVLYSLQHDDSCVECHEDVSDLDEVIVWLTLYVPGQERRDLSLQYHRSCFERAVNNFEHGAERLADRVGVQGGGPPTLHPGNPWTSWDQMGYTPS